MTQDAIVTKVMSNGLAEVLVERGTACGDTCGSCEVCKYANEIHTYAKNTLGAAIGDRVVIKTKSSDIIGAAFIMYIIPLIVMIAAYVLTAMQGAPETQCIAISFAAFFVCVLIVTVYQRMRAKKKQIEFEIVSYKLS